MSQGLWCRWRNSTGQNGANILSSSFRSCVTEAPTETNNTLPPRPAALHVWGPCFYMLLLLRVLPFAASFCCSIGRPWSLGHLRCFPLYCCYRPLVRRNCVCGVAMVSLCHVRFSEASVESVFAPLGREHACASLARC